MLPSDPGYVPAATDERLLQLPQYQELLRMNTDPFAKHSRDPGTIQWLMEFLQ
jgi:hypothetical protein